MPTVIVDGQEVQLGENERLNGIQAAARAGVDIPFYCWHAGLTVVASCRMCLVETGTKDPKTGQVSMVPKLVPACQTPAKDGTVFVTNSDKVKASRAMVQEDLLMDHPVDCPICDKAGECLLQDYYFEHGQKDRRTDIHPFTSRRRELGETVTLFVDRCVMCSRCVRFCREVSGTSELMVINRGSHEEIDVFPGFPLDNKLSGNVVDLCPVGALGDKDFLYRQRVWFMKKHASVCTHCSTGCSIWVDENQDTVHRLRPRENPHVNGWWMCDEGRYNYHHVHDARRVSLPRYLESSGVYADVDWQHLAVELPARLKAAGSLAAVLSPHLTVEEAYLLAKFIRSLDPQATLALGPVPTEGANEKFPKGFIIHAEKCPNRLGVEAVLAHFTGGVTTFDEFLGHLGGGNGNRRPAGVWISGGYESPLFDDTVAQRFEGLKELVVQDLFPSALMQRATWQLPAAAFAERDGSYVNYQHRLQSVKWSVRPPSGVWVEGPLYWRLLGGVGLFNAKQVRAELATTIPYFHVAGGDVPDVGVDLRINQLATAEAAASA